MFDAKKLLEQFLGSQVPGTSGSVRDKAGQVTDLAKRTRLRQALSPPPSLAPRPDASSRAMWRQWVALLPSPDWDISPTRIISPVRHRRKLNSWLRRSLNCFRRLRPILRSTRNLQP